MQLSHTDRRLYDGAYFVSFYIDVRPPDSSLVLATFLLWFADKAVRDYVTSDYNFNHTMFAQIRNIAYTITPSCICGMLLVDDALAPWYYSLVDKAEEDPEHHECSLTGSVLATYPFDYPSLRYPYFVQRCLDAARSVNFQIYNFCRYTHYTSFSSYKMAFVQTAPAGDVCA